MTPLALLASAVVAGEAAPAQPTAVADFRAICVETRADLREVEPAALARGWARQPSDSLPFWTKSADGAQMTLMAGEDRKPGRVRDVCHLVVRPGSKAVFEAGKAWMGPNPAKADEKNALYAVSKSPQAAKRREIDFLAFDHGDESTGLIYIRPKQ